MASGGLRYYLTLDSKGFERGVKAASTSMGGLTKGFGGVQRAAGLLGVSLGVGGLVAGVASATNAYSDLSEQISKSGVVFGKASSDVIAFSRTTARELGISQRAALEASGTFGNMLVPMGIARDRAAEMSTRFVKLAADMASFNNASPEDTLEALRAGLSGESEPLRRFGISLNDAALKAEALRLGLSDGKATLDAKTKAMATYSLVLKQTKDQQGDFARTSGGLANQQRILRARFEDLSAKIGSALVPAMVSVTTAVNRNWPKIMSVANGIRDAISGMVQFVDAIIKQDWSRAWSYAEKALALALRGVVAAVKSIGPWLLSAAKDAGKAIARGIWAGFEAGLKAIPGSGALRRFLGMSSGDISQSSITAVIGGRGVTTRARGGWIPGRYDAADDVPALLSRGEVVLNPRQARMVGVGRINSALAVTGGVMGGGMFASGGWVYPAPGTRKFGGPGQGTHSYSAAPNNWQSDTAYDLMGVDGGRVIAPHDGVITGTRPFSSDPRFWGMAAYLDVPGQGQFYLKHMKSLAVRPGQRVTAGQLIGYLGKGVNGGPHLHIGATTRALLERAVGGSKDPSAIGASGHETSAAEAKDAPPGLSAKAARAQVPRLMRGGLATGPGLTDIPSIDARHEDDDVQARAARAQGLPDSRVLQMQKKELEDDVADITSQIRRLNGQIGTLRRKRGRYRNEMVAKGTKPARRLRLRDAIAGVNDRLTELLDAVRSLEQEKRQILRQMVILGYDIQDAQKDEATAGTDGGDTTAGGVGKGAVPDAQVEYSASRTEFAFAATGAGDIGSGGRTAWDAIWGPAGMPVNVTVQAIHPGDPYVLDQVGRTVVAALQGRSSTPATTYMSGA